MPRRNHLVIAMNTMAFNVFLTHSFETSSRDRGTCQNSTGMNRFFWHALRTASNLLSQILRFNRWLHRRCNLHPFAFTRRRYRPTSHVGHARNHRGEMAQSRHMHATKTCINATKCECNILVLMLPKLTFAPLRPG